MAFESSTATSFAVIAPKSLPPSPPPARPLDPLPLRPPAVMPPPQEEEVEEAFEEEYEEEEAAVDPAAPAAGEGAEGELGEEGEEEPARDPGLLRKALRANPSRLQGVLNPEQRRPEPDAGLE